MKRTHSSLTPDEDFFFGGPEEEGEEGNELQDRLRHARPTFGLLPGESAFEVDGASGLRARPKWTRADGTLMRKTKKGNVIRIAEKEEEYGPSWENEEFQRKDIVNRDPRIGFFRLLAGCTYQDVESLFDHNDIENQKRYDDELREWNKIERERLMVGSDAKKVQLDIVEARHESMRQRGEILDWSARFVDRFGEDMRFLLVPGLAMPSGNAASLPLCYLIKEQYTLAEKLMQTAISLEEKFVNIVDEVARTAARDAERVHLGPFRNDFITYFIGPAGALFEHERADGFLTYANTSFIRPNHADLSSQEFLRFALSVYKYLYTRDEYMPGLTMVAEGTSTLSTPVGPAQKRKVRAHDIIYDTSKELYFLYLRNQALELYFVEFLRIQPRGERLNEVDKDAAVEAAKPRNNVRDDGAYHVAKDDLDFFRKYKTLEASLKMWQDNLLDADKKRADGKMIQKNIDETITQMAELTSRTAGRYENILEAVNTPISEESFRSLFSGKKQKERLLQTIAKGLDPTPIPDPKGKGKDRPPPNPNLPMLEWFRKMGSSNATDKMDFMDIGDIDEVTRGQGFKSRLKYADVIATTTSLISSVSYLDGKTYLPNISGDALTQAGDWYIATGLLFSENVDIVFDATNTNKVSVTQKPGFQYVDGFAHLANLFADVLSKKKALVVVIFFHPFSNPADKIKKQMKDELFAMLGKKEGKKSWITLLLEGLFFLPNAPPRIEALTPSPETTSLIASSSLNTNNGLDHFNVVYLDTGYESEWKVGLEQLEKLDYLTKKSKIIDTAVDRLMEPLLSGGLASLVLFAYHEKTIDYFQSGALEVPLAAYSRFVLFIDPADGIDEPTKFLATMDQVIDNLKPTNSTKDSKRSTDLWHWNDLAQLLSLQRHRSLYMVLYLFAWGNYIYPTEREKLDDEMTNAANVIRDAEAELYRLAMGGTLSIKDQRDKVKALYVPTARWQTRTENTGRVQLQPTVVMALDEAFTLVREKIPTLSDATLDALMLSDMESGLPGAFARLVGALMNRTQLVWPQTYNKDMQYRIDPALRQSCLNNLVGYTVTALPGGRYKAQRVHALEWRPQPSAATSGPVVSVFFL